MRPARFCPAHVRIIARSHRIKSGGRLGDEAIRNLNRDWIASSFGLAMTTKPRLPPAARTPT